MKKRCREDKFPELYCFLPDKLTTTYEYLLRTLKSKAMENGLVFAPPTIMVDYELAIHNAIRSVLSNTTIKGCLFHYGQALNSSECSSV